MIMQAVVGRVNSCAMKRKQLPIVSRGTVIEHGELHSKLDEGNTKSTRTQTNVSHSIEGVMTTLGCPFVYRNNIPLRFNG